VTGAQEIGYQRMAMRLPVGWRWASLGELAIVGPDNGIFKRRHEFGRGVPIVNVSDLYRSLVVDLNQVERVEATEDEQHRYSIASGDLFFCRSSLKREGVGWCCYVREVPEPAVFDCHIMRIRLHPEKALPEYVAYYWAHPSVREEVISNARTATMTTMNQGDLARVKIPLPPIPEQKRIAAILNEQMTALERARTAAEAQLAAAKALPAAYLREVFESPEAKKWSKQSLRAICDSDGQYGTSEKADTTDIGIPVLRMGNIFEGGLLWDDLKFIQLPESEIQKYQLKKGDILFNRTNSAELVGKTAVFDGVRNAIFASYLIRFRLILYRTLLQVTLK